MPDLLTWLALKARIEEPVAIVVAHPDDETVGLASRMSSFADLTLIHLTDGAPRDLRDANRAGFASRQSYAAAREAELGAALDRLGIRPKRVAYEAPDQETAPNLPAIIERLRSDLGNVAAVFTHPYEHGHPDHDSAALAVALAAPGLPRFEMAYYHQSHSGPRFGAFSPDAACPEVVIRLSPEEQAEKAEALACFVTQAGTLAQFGLDTERLRPAPNYNFTRIAPPGVALYETWGFAENAAAWRAYASRVVDPACAA